MHAFFYFILLVFIFYFFETWSSLVHKPSPVTGPNRRSDWLLPASVRELFTHACHSHNVIKFASVQCGWIILQSWRNLPGSRETETWWRTGRLVAFFLCFCFSFASSPFLVFSAWFLFFLLSGFLLRLFFCGVFLTSSGSETKRMKTWGCWSNRTLSSASSCFSSSSSLVFNSVFFSISVSVSPSL